MAPTRPGWHFALWLASALSVSSACGGNPGAPDDAGAGNESGDVNAAVALDSAAPPEGGGAGDASSDGAVVDADAEAGPTCGDAGAGEILCGATCVSANDVAHCGACTTTCPPPPSGNGSPVCPAAHCGVTCLAGYHLGGASCSADCLADTGDPSTDPCVVVNGRGTFVSPIGSDTTGDGTKEHPFGTLRRAMAATATARVYACGTFSSEQLVVDASIDGVSVYGGFDCVTWKYAAGSRTVLAPTARGYALEIDGLVKGVTFEDFAFTAVAAAPNPPASGPGASSTAVIVNAAAGVVFRRSTFQAGQGQPGATGVTGTNAWSGSAQSGSPGSGTTGGTALNCACGGTSGEGGYPSVLDVGTNQFLPGADGTDGTPLGVANHGTGIKAIFNGNHCTLGGAGSAGGGGAPGVGASGIGSLAFPAGFTNAAVAGAGGTGIFAQGGGGGGGDITITGNPPDGAGGGGGCGGCGGAGAASGGASGGSSIALVVLTSYVTLDACALTASAGGTGGKGGDGVAGQAGGAGGTATGPAPCAGGPGGTGGTGGAGGGGVGGHSIAVAYTGTAPNEVGTVLETPASTVAPGGSPGGGVSNAGSQGQPGLAVPEQTF